MLGIGVGSRTSTGGVVIEGNNGVLFDGLIASSVGHKATCPACKKGFGDIVAIGSRTVCLPEGLAARAGDYVACGCPPGSNVLVARGTVVIGHEGRMPFEKYSPTAGAIEYSMNTGSRIETDLQSKARDESFSVSAKGRADTDANRGEDSSNDGLTIRNDESAPPGSGAAENPENFRWRLDSSQYTIRQVAYLPAEGVGVNGTFFLKGSLALNERGLFVSAMGFTAAARLGKVQFQATVKVELNGNEIIFVPVKIGKEAGLWPVGDYLPIGSININVPTPQANDVMQVTISGTYIYSAPEGRAIPMPSTGVVTISVRAVVAK